MRDLDWNIVGTRVERLPKLAQPIALLARNLKLSLRSSPYHHRMDGIATRNIDLWRERPRFRRAYGRATEASTWDYKIPYRIQQALWCSHQAQKVPGDYVELGTGRGFFMSAILADIPDWNVSQRQLYLLDTFTPYWVNDTGGQTEADRVSPYYAKSVDDVRRNFEVWSNVNVVQGNVYDTLKDLDTTTIAMLHLDLNFHEPEIWALRLLWNRIPRGGVVLFDDYAMRNCENQFNAINGVAEEFGFEVLATPTGQGIVIK
jgi:hypothetical protein